MLATSFHVMTKETEEIFGIVINKRLKFAIGFHAHLLLLDYVLTTGL